ncbi:anthranilate phosphoribosyltransferase [Clostridium manihotivorum]|uniref:Anthranilate phosphoribosyltransferase n=1 Tax=Clostridium manihotivorum TaxID=2320868 RepID=A0A3R5QWK7_9CLOT|nr:anthranilate phosphoribosyltransferase [Clostridium manihotivorum]QAA33968.1 anthranilate phosphoribosyltransferase [Clostridium manihotivorum]
MKAEFQSALRKVIINENLSFEEAYEANKYILSGEAEEGEIGAFLAALKTKGEHPQEIAGMAKAMRELSSIDFDIEDSFDNCGTGGDYSNSFNISTTSAFVLAGAGVKVAKHGNRSISSKCGSADLLAELGVNIEIQKEKLKKLIEEVGIAFLYAPAMHPRMKYVMKVRKALGIPTVYNILGPLTNPLNPSNQLIGVYKKELVKDLCEALKLLGKKRALVINGDNRLDEGTLDGDNYCAFLVNGEVKEMLIKSSDYGIDRIGLEHLAGGDAKENSRITLSILNGEKSTYREAVVFNSALGLFASGVCEDIKSGIDMAKDILDSGKAKRKLESLIEESNRI